MQTATIVVLTCLLAVVVVQAQPTPVQQESVAENIQELDFEIPAHDRTSRNKRGLLLLKKKLILGALGLKAAKLGAAAGVVGAIAYKSKSKPKSVRSYHTYYHHGW